MDEQIKNKIYDIISNQIGVEKEEITPDANLMKDLNAQKLEVVDLMVAIENELGIMISEEEISQIETIDDLLSVVTDHLQ